MADYTVTPDDEYDVLIQDEVENETVWPESCDPNPVSVLTAQQMPWLFSIICVLGLLDGVLMVFLLVKHKGLKHQGKVYFLQLAVSNFCFWLPLPFWAHPISQQTNLGDLTCTVVTGCHSVAVYSKVAFLVVLILQTYQASLHARWLTPGLETTAGKILTSILAWGLAVGVNLPELAFYQPSLQSQTWKCAWSQQPFPPSAEPSWKYFLTLKMNILLLAIPLAVWLFCGVRMSSTLTLSARQDDLARLVFLLMLIFLLTWAPYQVALLLSTIQPPSTPLQDCKIRRRLDTGVQITRIIAITHCGISATFYLLLDAVCRSRVCRRLLGCGNGSLGLRDQNSSASVSPGQRQDHCTHV
ncbi:C-C chemokine receptor-like 2 [Dipodomys merriami]|uniref:C-C chemokine receptor-like 2 n=1 Tax=Dipodomys merriami TaxID=94247 RepID=UPI00384DA081